ncbi:MAG: hypothetical protein RR107_06925 [Clostridia bacterium]
MARTKQITETPTSQRQDWKIQDNAIKVFNELKAIGNERTLPKIMRFINKIAKQNDVDKVTASEILWREVNSNSQLYKQAGNGIVIQVLEQIFKEML